MGQPGERAENTRIDKSRKKDPWVKALTADRAKDRKHRRECGHLEQVHSLSVAA